MKIFSPERHVPGVSRRSRVGVHPRTSDHGAHVSGLQLVPDRVEREDDPDSSNPLDFTAIYGARFQHVVRWIRALGAPASELEDIAQDVFMVVRRRLGEFDGQNLAGWLYRITQRTVRDHRRRAWFRYLFLGRRQLDLDELPVVQDGPFTSLERKEDRQLLEELLSRMSEKRRIAFVLFEIEGYSGDELAEMLEIPINTVWTRLYHARKDFTAMVTRLHLREERGR